MACILHLTDLHLGNRSADQKVDDYKSDIVPENERINRIALLRSTLRGLSRYLKARKQTLDAVIVSGDITIGGDPDGLNSLPNVLIELQDTLPRPDHIVVVPGNHDVVWRTPPSSPDRYKHFLDFVRSKGYITPFLDGIDLPPKATPSNYGTHHLTLNGGAIEVIPLNSSNYCGCIEGLRGITEDEWNAIPGLLKRKKQAGARKELSRLRTHDVARFSPQQFEAVGKMLQSLSGPGSIGQIRVAVLHHQLLPVSMREEFKSYEAIVNLGMLMHFLRANSFDVIIHGHKHTPLAYWLDLNRSSGRDIATIRDRALVISGSTLSASGSHSREICSLLTMTSGHTKEVVLSPVIPVDAGIPIEKLGEERFRFWDVGGICTTGVHSPKILMAGSFAGLYEQLLSYFRDRSEYDPVNHLICEVQQGEYPVNLPSSYPDVPLAFAGDRQMWLNELVRWWQHMKPTRDPTAFTHGARIYKYRGRHDQFQGAVRALREKQNTSRALIALIDPPSDGWSSRKKAPSFCSLQFLINRRGNDLVLDCVAYFRKQEMRYWWPVNFAEVALMQNKAIEALLSNYPGLSSGSIITIASIAYASQTLPRVAVPIIDRLLDEDEDTLWQLAHSLVWPENTDLSSIGVKWQRLLEDLTPAPKADPDGVPIAIVGLTELIREINRFQRFHAGPFITEAHARLSALLKANTSYAEDTASEVLPDRHARWREDSMQILADLRTVLARCGLLA